MIEEIKASTDIVTEIGKYIELRKEGSSFKGLCPFHNEKTPSFSVNPESQKFKCFGCGEHGDVVDFVAKAKNLSIKEACRDFKNLPPAEPNRQPQKPPQKKKRAKAVPLPYQAAKDHYTRDTLQRLADGLFKNSEQRHLVKAWSYKNEAGDVELVACRFERDNGKKDVLSFYWDGHNLKMSGYPVLLFNRDRLANEPEKPVLFVEGEKAAEAAEQIPGFVPVTFNGGGQKINEVDLSPLQGREVYVYPDDDQQKDRQTGEMLPPEKQPGIKLAMAIKKMLPHAKILQPILAARAIKPDGADIVEAIEAVGVDGVLKHILDHKEPAAQEPQASEEPTETTIDIKTKKLPFTVLGIADDSKAYFIGATERLYALNPLSISKTQLYNLAGLEWWRTEFGDKAKNWEEAISGIIYLSQQTDFDPERMRGRGAWREPDGRICYHDGKNTMGEPSSERIYLRRAQKKIGINGDKSTPEERKAIRDICHELTFETSSDCIRTLGWAALAPFAGALPWRPAGLLTAASGAGKSTIVNKIIKPLVNPIICSGGESTAAGIRQRIGIDSCSIVIEEAETDTQKKKQNREDTLSLMRQSTSDDSPDVLKGTIDGRGLSFTLRSMFFFVAISPEIECEADENRIFRVNLTKAGYSRRVWLDKEKRLLSAINDKVCRKIRAYTWENLKKIIDLAERVSVQAQIAAEVDSRTAFAESLLLAAYMAVFEDKLNPDNSEIIKFVMDFYNRCPIQKRRNENEEMLDNLLDHIIRDGVNSYTIREVLGAIKTGKIYSNADLEPGQQRVEQDMPSYYARRLAGIYGLGMTADDHVAIAKNHPEIKKILGKGNGYHQQMARHPGVVDRGKNVSLGSGNTRNCLIIKLMEKEDA